MRGGEWAQKGEPTPGAGSLFFDGMRSARGVMVNGLKSMEVDSCYFVFLVYDVHHD